MSEAAPAPAAQLPTLPSFFSLVVRDIVDSTNDEVVERAENGALEGLLVWAHRQRQGRGRSGRRWESPAGNLYCSVLLRPMAQPSIAAQLVFVVGIAVRECVAQLVEDDRTVLCKWPNDILIDGAKVAGILLEAVAEGETTRVVVGIGVNVAEHPDETVHPATDLFAHAEENVTAAAVLELLAPTLVSWYHTWQTEGFEPIREAWLAHAAGLGETVAARLPNYELHGEFVSLDEHGALELRTPDEETHLVTVGEVFISRAGIGG